MSCNNNSGSSSNEPTIIRKLGLSETYFQHEIEVNACINVSAILFETSKDLYSNLDLLNRAVNIWKRTQPLLRSKIITKSDFVNETENGKYFAFADKERVESLDNVSYLYFKSTSSSGDGNGDGNKKLLSYDDSKDYWKLLFEREMQIPIDWSDGLMWRLTFVNLNSSDTNHVNGYQNGRRHLYKYCLLISVTHTIFDGSSAFITLSSLFQIIEALWMKWPDDADLMKNIKEGDILKPVEQLALDFLNENQLQKIDYRKIDGFKRPEPFLLKPDASDRTVSYPIKDTNHARDAAFYSVKDHSLFITLDELMNISERSVTKFHTQAFKNDDKYKYFLAKCKEKNVKFTGVFHLIFVAAWRKVYEQMKANTSTEKNGLKQQQQPINYLTTVSMRPFMKNVNPNSLVWFCNHLFTRYDQEFNYNDGDDQKFFADTIWQLAKQESDTFHDRLKKNEHFEFFQKQNPMQPDEIRLHYGLSNLVVPTQIINQNKLLRIDEMYTLTSYRRDWTNDLSYHNIVSIDESMFWIFYFNSYFVKNDVINLFIENVNHIYDRLCSI